MVRYWDPSAIVPLLVRQARTHAVLDELGQHPGIITWWGSAVECASALARVDREGGLPGLAADTARVRYRLLARRWAEVGPSEPVRQTALRLLRTHPLRAADTLQLAAAIAASEGVASSLPFVTLDLRLAEAADKEGFPVVIPGGVQ